MIGGLHGGDIYGGGIRDDFSVNVNPLGLPVSVLSVLKGSVDEWECYPDPECRELVGRLAEHHGVERERIVCGNGAADLIYRLVYWIKPRKALVLTPTFSEYERALLLVGCHVRRWNLREDENFRVDVDGLAKMLEEGELLFLCNPNNPTGLAVSAKQVERLAQACGDKGGLLVLDECFCEFLDKPENCSFVGKIGRYPRTVILRAFTKSYAMAGLRLGYAVCGDRTLAEGLRLTGQPWSVSVPAQKAGVAALGEREYLDQARRMVAREREWVEKELAKLGFRVFPSQVNYLLFKDMAEDRHGNLWKQLRERGILIRNCKNFCGLNAFPYYRVGIRKHEANERLIEAVGGIVRDRD